MEYEIAQVESFADELGRAPKPVKNAMKRVYGELRNHPQDPQPPKIMRLKGWKGLWRLRVSDSYRLVYRLESGSKRPTITLLMLGDRKNVYERLGRNTDGTPDIRIVASGVEDLLDSEPTPAEVGDAILKQSLQEDNDPDLDAPLPIRLTEDVLAEWGVPDKHFGILTAVETEGDLISARVPGGVIERVMDGIWPSPIERVVQEPVRIIPDAEAMLSASETADLLTLLLKLDPEQEAFVSRFQRTDPEGPWLLKGGPGSGKSVVALYCIKSLIDQEEGKLPGQRRSLKILLTTYTNSLVNAARHMQRSLNSGPGHTIDVLTVDKVAGRFRKSSRSLSPARDDQLKGLASKALTACKRKGDFSFTAGDVDYLLEEVDWVIAGQDLQTVEEYVNKADRTGRRRAFGRSQRQQAWRFYEQLRAELEEGSLCLWVDLQREALSQAKPSYDYVFVDEAQDLKPVAVRFLQRLAKEPGNLFLTADSNQSIYGTGMSWARVAEDVNFSGRAQILRKNYRTTKEIWRAVADLGLRAEDDETLRVEPVFSGQPPVLVRFSGSGWADRLNRFLYEGLREERLGPDSAAVLVPWNKHATEVAKRIDTRLNPKAFKTKDVDITHAGVKVLTMHGAKGLEFPIVAIWGVDGGVLPSRMDSRDPDQLARAHRLLFVAATRAMRQLLILTQGDNPSPFLSGVSDEHWVIERI